MGLDFPVTFIREYQMLESVSASTPLRDAPVVPELKTSYQFGPLLCRKDAARYLGVAPQTLAQWACSRSVSLPFVKIGRKVMYRRADLDAFIAANTHGVLPTSAAGELE